MADIDTVGTRVSARGPVQAGERSLAPDLARGVMLLLIALANTPFYLWAAEQGTFSVHPVDGSTLDLVVDGVILTVVDSRVYPMFAFLFGYGMVQLYTRQVAAGTPERTARRLLLRRNAWLVAWGFVHAALLWAGDVLGAYGLAGLVIGGIFFRRKDRTLLVWAGIFTGLLVVGTVLAVVGAVFAAQTPPPAESTSIFADALDSGEESYWASVVGRLSFWPLISLGQGLLGLVIPAVLLLAFWAGRRQILERPGDHLPLLRRVVLVGLPVAWLGGLAHALQHAGILGVPDQVGWLFVISQFSTGLFGGLAYVAIFGLLGHRLTRSPQPDGTARPSVVVTAVTAVGRRSLTCYLAQSVICAPVLAAWGLGLGEVLSSWSMALFAAAVWLVTVVMAYAMERRGVRGPAEVLLRRLVYRSARTA